MNILTRKALPRRTLLKGLGVALALPILDAMTPALSQSQSPAKTRFGFIYVPNGVCQEQWEPKVTQQGWELSRILQPLAPVRQHVNVISGTSLLAPAAHFVSNSMWLAGIVPPKTSQVRLATTVDQLIAAHIGRDSTFPSLELAIEDIATSGGTCEGGYPCAISTTISWSSPSSPLPMEINPKIVFERLFGDSGSGSDADRLARARDNASILDAITDSVGTLRKGLGARDQARLGDYLDSVREIERRVQGNARGSLGGLTLPATPTGIPDSYEQHVKLMFELQALAYQADLTRVASFMLAKELSPITYPQVGVPDAHHAVSHNEGIADLVEKFIRVNTYHHKLFAEYVARLAATPDGDGTLLDHSVLLYGSGMGASNNHAHDDLPIVLAGGGSGQLKGGRHIKVPAKTSLANLHVRLLQVAGIETDRFGDSTGRIDA